MKLKGYTIKDTGEKVIIIQNTALYKVKSTGNVFESSGEIKVKDFNDLVKLNSKTRTKYIKHKETGETLSELEYLEKEKELLSKRDYDADEYTYNWKSLDDEFNYRKFIASYDRVNETFYEEEEVIVEEVKEVILNTSHPFITSKFSTQGELSDICVYDKHSAYLHFAKEKLKEIGAEEIPYIAFSKNTDGKLAWSNPTHSTIRFLKFAGSYIFNDSFEVNHPKVGKFDDLVLECDRDRETIRKIIHDAYVLKFGKFDENLTPTVVQAVEGIKSVLNYLDKVVANKKSTSNLNSAKNLLKEVKENLNNTFKI